MKATLRTTTALSATALAILAAGCANPMARLHASASRTSAPLSATAGTATRAHLALAGGDYAAAVRFAEQAVENSPNDASFRLLLGNAYLASGRFVSAEAAFNDAMTLAPDQSGVAMKLVLAAIAQGKGGQSIQLLDQLRGAADPADVGLALALAGQPGNAVALLDEAARRPDADARTRQNLALAHALAGDWEMARVVAGQDLAPDQLDARLAEWMKWAAPGNSGQQVASLLGVTPAASDPGQPQRLALQDTAVRLASVQPVAVAPEPAAPVAMTPAEIAPPVEMAVEMAAADIPYTPPLPGPSEASEAGFAEAPVPAAPVAAPASSVTMALPPAEPAPEPEQLADVAQALDSLRREPVRAGGALPRVSQLRKSAAARFARSGVVVQLGAYGSPGRVKTAWGAIARRHASLGRYIPATARFQARTGTVYRLSLKGFASDGEARRLCETLKRSGSSCFVRSSAGDAPVRFASR